MNHPRPKAGGALKPLPLPLPQQPLDDCLHETVEQPIEVRVEPHCLGCSARVPAAACDPFPKNLANLSNGTRFKEALPVAQTHALDEPLVGVQPYGADISGGLTSNRSGGFGEGLCHWLGTLAHTFTLRGLAE